MVLFNSNSCGSTKILFVSDLIINKGIILAVFTILIFRKSVMIWHGNGKRTMIKPFH